MSVIVPVRDGASSLETLLTALRAQTYPRSRTQIIVVDNGLNGDLRKRQSEDAPIVVVEEPQVGSYAARNRGWQVANGDVLAFTDADCVPSETWLEEGVRALNRELGCAVGGVVEPVFSSRSPGCAELYDGATAIAQDVLIRDRGFAATANLFVAKDVFDRVGPFDASLESGGDRVWGHRALSLGIPIAFAPEVVVRHPARKTLGEILARVRRMNRGVGPLSKSPVLQGRPKGRWLRYVWHNPREIDRRVAPYTTRWGRLRVQGCHWIVKLYQLIDGIRRRVVE